ncbi:universal stress protein [Planomicrobium sp. CPCC 101079]|uniref:universal stress protein n=1 Tax=Planomicrobium sp. CPCC 101079 TaxID=2599618 RepID=UPI0011B4DE0D|nr:universal stress protein [Planomicrobium sp. CPCC 101079]TWT01877.1 universal stress protein [Planomicrobium sp. CPCC 101079]
MTFVYKQILAAVDGSDEAKWAFQKAIEIAKRNNAGLHLIHVTDLRTYTTMTKRVPDLDDRIYDQGKEFLDRYRKEAEAAGVLKVNTILASGSPKTVISRDYAKQVKADLIVCGAQGLNAVEHFLMGSVSEHIVRSSPCDVLVVRGQGEKAES